MNGDDVAEAQVLVQEQSACHGGRIGIATLNAPKSLNALTLPMILRLAEVLQRWARDPEVVCVVLAGAGEKAFCAGGDVRSLRTAILEYTGSPPNPYALEFFAAEYRLDFQIHRFTKPMVVWGDGAVMGGGLGLLAGASHRVVTGTSRLAMPEISIGLYPDVGASWFLQRLPFHAGLFLALTGAHLNGADARVLGLADVFAGAAQRQAVIDAMAAVQWTDSVSLNHVRLTEALRVFEAAAAESCPVSNVELHAEIIERVVQGRNLGQVAGQLMALRDHDSAWLRGAVATFAAGSPTSAALIWEIWQRARTLSLADAFRMELVLSLQCCANPDLAEGVRALLVDRDKAPRWQPPTLAAVSPALIDGYFSPPWLDRAVQALRDLS